MCLLKGFSLLAQAIVSAAIQLEHVFWSRTLTEELQVQVVEHLQLEIKCSFSYSLPLKRHLLCTFMNWLREGAAGSDWITSC